MEIFPEIFPHISVKEVEHLELGVNTLLGSCFHGFHESKEVFPWLTLSTRKSAFLTVESPTFVFLGLSEISDVGSVD